jgi:pSer/pThr/pTyr-binding forkhead associated (FHA) protein
MPHLLLAEKGSGKSYRIESNDALIGRDPSCKVFVEGELAKTVSGRHARVFLDDRGWFVEDASSRNGTYVGGRKVEPGVRHALSVGDVIGLGLTGTQLTVQEVVGRGVAATMMEPAPAIPSPAVVVTKDHIRIVLRALQSGVTSVGQGDRITIGRALDCVIRIEGDSATSVSRVHAEVALTNGKIVVSDGGSRHGTFVNGTKIVTVTPISAGDVLMLGPGGPSFSVDQLGMVSSASVVTGMSPVSSSADSSVGPTDVRAAASRVSPSGPSGAAMQPTPSADLPAYRKTSSPASSPAAGDPQRPRRRSDPPAHTGLLRNVLGDMNARNARLFRTMVWSAVGVFTIATAAILFVGSRAAKESDVQEDNGVRQQAAELEASRNAAVSDAAHLRASLDSATQAAAPAAIVDSLRKAVGEADQRSARLEDSLKRARAAAVKK